MKLRTLVEATSKFGEVTLYISEDDLAIQEPGEFHVGDEFGPVNNMHQIYKFGNGTKLYIKLHKVGRDWLAERAMLINGQLIHPSTPGFDIEWNKYKDAISGSLIDSQQPFGLPESQEFRKVFNL